MQYFAVDAVHLLLSSCFLYLFSSSTAAQVYIDHVNCNAASNYTSGSVYEQNLNSTLTSLDANSSLSGFYITSVGQNPDVVYGLIQCKGDLSNIDCQTCANTAATAIRHHCVNQKEASFLIDECWIRYSNWNFSSTVDGFVRVCIPNPKDATDVPLFNRQLQDLVESISSQAAASPSKFAVGFTDYTGFLNIYAMVQCTRDLVEDGCLNCLQGLFSFINKCCDRKEGGHLFSLSCNLRYEIYPFFSQLAPRQPEVSSSPSPSLPEQHATTTGTSQALTSSEKKKNLEVVVFAVITVAVVLVVILIIFSCFLWGSIRRKTVEGLHVDGDKGMESLSMDLSTLKVATDNFSDAHKLGEGGFGPVYKGKLLDGREIAVKRLSRSSAQGLEELRTEVLLVAKLLHRNPIRLLGFCLEEEEKLLVYEYLPNGSLDKFLFDQSQRFYLEWERRSKIIVGIAGGLLYLHEDSQLKIIHRDLKASNILLDECMNPKISYFGLAGGSHTHANTNQIAGTHGYMAPEYASRGQFSAKSDVYSFGILLLEIVAGRKNFSFCNIMNLQSYAWQQWANGTTLELIDPYLGDQWPRSEVLRCIHIGLLCVQETTADRPTMSEVVIMLNSQTIPSRAPSRPAFFVTAENTESGLMTGDSDHYQSL